VTYVMYRPVVELVTSATKEKGINKGSAGMFSSCKPVDSHSLQLELAQSERRRQRLVVTTIKLVDSSNVNHQHQKFILHCQPINHARKDTYMHQKSTTRCL